MSDDPAEPKLIRIPGVDGQVVLAAMEMTDDQRRQRNSAGDRRQMTTQWRYTPTSGEVVRSDGVLIAREVPPEFGPMIEAMPELLVALQRLHTETQHLCRQLAARGLPGVKGDTVDQVMAEAKSAIARARP